MDIFAAGRFHSCFKHVYNSRLLKGTNLTYHHLKICQIEFAVRLKMFNFQVVYHLHVRNRQDWSLVHIVRFCVVIILVSRLSTLKACQQDTYFDHRTRSYYSTHVIFKHQRVVFIQQCCLLFAHRFWNYGRRLGNSA